MQFIGIDVGRDSVKVFTENKCFKFKSKVAEWRQRKLINESEEGKYEIELDGEKYFIADLAVEGFYEREMLTESKINFETKLLFLSALALALKDDKNYQVITGLPVKQHIEEIKKQLNILLSGDYLIKVNKKVIRININNIWIAPEGAASAWDLVLNENGKLISSPLLDSKIRVIDIGNRTINYCTLDKFKYIDKESGTLDYGCVLLKNADNYSLDNFARKIYADLSARWLTFNHTDIVVISGGGALLLKENFKNIFQIVYFNDDYGNARGYYKMGRLKWQKENVK